MLQTRFLWDYCLEPPHDKTNKMACAPSEDTDQPGHLPSLIRVFAVRMKKAWVLSYPLSAQLRQIRLGRCPGQSEFVGRTVICWFCHEAAQSLLKGYGVIYEFFAWDYLQLWSKVFLETGLDTHCRPMCFFNQSRFISNILWLSITKLLSSGNEIWAAARQNKMTCPQQRLRSAWACA